MEMLLSGKLCLALLLLPWPICANTNEKLHASSCAKCGGGAEPHSVRRRDAAIGEEDRRIVGGYDAVDRPWVVLVFIPTESSVSTCGGAIANNRSERERERRSVLRA
jgi:hypothetical protein